jgi:hypothetical protein
MKNENQIVERTMYHGFFLWALYGNPYIGLSVADDADVEQPTAANIAEH